jgi:tRNA pseudouridine13 synthase
MLGIPHPYLTPDLPGIGGVIKTQPEDFLVTEVPLYAPAGRGEHTYFEIEKCDLSTIEALERLHAELGVELRDFGYAGLKDRKGITRQVISVAGKRPEEILALRVPQMQVLWATLHTNKLRVGHLRGNRFRIVIREIAAPAGERVPAILAVLERRGVPNYFGPQRFGNRGDAHLVGRDLLRKDDEAAIRRILGHPASTERNPNVVRARELFMQGDLLGARDAFPPSYREEKKLLHYLSRAGENYSGARKRLGEMSRKLYFTAYQSYLFNLTLGERLARTGGRLDVLLEGDLAYLHRNGAVFPVKETSAEGHRLATFEISPSGPIFGMKMPQPEGHEAAIECGVLEREGVNPAEFHQLMPRLHLEGGRRPFRVRVEEVAWQIEGGDLRIEFFLPRGSYATTLLRELMKNDEVPEAFYAAGEEEKHRLWRPRVA